MSQLTDMKGAIFDLDGTLLDSMPVWQQLAASYLRKNGFIPKENLWENLKALSLSQGITYLKENYEINKTDKMIEQELNKSIERSYLNEIPLKKGVRAYLELLKELGISMCIATATDKHLARVSLKRLDALRYFSEIFTCQELGCGKDTPFIFESALQSLQIAKKDAYVFEDALHAATTARNAGFRVIGVYDESAKADWEKLKKVAEKSIFSMEELV